MRGGRRLLPFVAVLKFKFKFMFMFKFLFLFLNLNSNSRSCLNIGCILTTCMDYSYTLERRARLSQKTLYWYVNARFKYSLTRASATPSCPACSIG